MLVMNGSPLIFSAGKTIMPRNSVRPRTPKVSYGKISSEESDSGYGGVLQVVSVPQGLYGYKPGQSHLVNSTSMSGYGLQLHGNIKEIGDSISSDISTDISKLATTGLNFLTNAISPSSSVPTPTLTEQQIITAQQATQPSAFGNMMPYMLIAALGLGAMLIMKKRKQTETKVE